MADHADRRVRYGLPEISQGSYFEPFARYDVSFAGDPSKKFMSNLQFAPMFNISLPDRSLLTLYPNPEIRWNFENCSSLPRPVELFLPFDARIGKKLSSSLDISLEVSIPIVKQYPVYDFMTALRINFTY